MFAKRNLGWIGIVVLSLTPLIPWYFALLPFEFRYTNAFSFFTSVGDVLGLIGITMFSLNLILSARLKLFEDYFGGMNRAYVAHHLFGGIALILLLFHPLLLASSRLTVSFKEAAFFLLPGNDWSTNFGIAGLLLMMSLLILTFFVNLPYQVWRFTHKFLGAVFLIASIHGFFIASDISRYMPLKIYMLVIVGLGTLAYIYRTLLGRFFVRRYAFTVEQVLPVNDAVVRIDLAPSGKKMSVVPGQFIFISFNNTTVGNEVHPFSVGSVSDDGRILIIAKAEGDYTKRLKNLAVGDIASIEGGFGRFIFQLYSNKQQVWVAGGIGIVPFLSMVNDLVTSEYAVDLYYTVRTPDEAVYLDGLVSFTKNKPDFRVFPIYTKTQGRLTAETIAATSGDIAQKEFFICGPPLLMKSLRKQLVTFHVPNRHIHTEEFTIL